MVYLVPLSSAKLATRVWSAPAVKMYVPLVLTSEPPPV